MTAEAQDIISKIDKAKKIQDILDIKNLKKEFHKISMIIHPDKCDHPDAKRIFQKLTELKENFEKGITYADEAGKFISNGYVSTYKGNLTLFKESLGNYRLLNSFNDESSKNFKRYLPKKLERIGDDIVSEFGERAIPLTGLTLPQKHVNWILSRMLEFCAWINQKKLVHCGINPESVFVMPENHGIQIGSFYLMAGVGERVKGISGKYKNWYPPQLFTTKKLDARVDLELCMKTAICLLGDPSGIGVKLKKDPNINQEMLGFMMRQHEDPAICWKEYRSLLDKNFKKEFHILDL